VKADIDLTVSYPHPPQRVWNALTSSQALTAWLMPNDFEPAVGHRFTLRTKPSPVHGFDGTVRCQVLELDAPRRMVWSWAGGPIETTVTFTLEPDSGSGTRLRMHQEGFTGLGGQMVRTILASGWPGLLRRRLLASLDQLAGVSLGPAGPDPASPDPVSPESASTCGPG
jgi:uncharacterized protein YndB with AHSA1/START domain